MLPVRGGCPAVSYIPDVTWSIVQGTALDVRVTESGNVILGPNARPGSITVKATLKACDGCSAEKKLLIA
jgi:hypothetical protein